MITPPDVFLRIVIDTNVHRAALCSAHGASALLLEVLPHPSISVLLSLPLWLEYQEVLTRVSNLPAGMNSSEVLEALREFAVHAEGCESQARPRRSLRDPDDEMVLDLAIAGRATHIVTFNVRDFAGVEKDFGIQVVTPGQFVAKFRELL